jgi:hypothetical protein
MSQASVEYERFISELIEQVKKTGREITHIGYGNKNLLAGNSGQQHQIDVSFIDSSFSDPTLVLIECKRWKDSVDVTVPKVLKYNMDDITENREYPNKAIGIITTTSGFQSGVSTIADHEGIIIQVVNHGPPYGFRYENIIQMGMQDKIGCRRQRFI